MLKVPFFSLDYDTREENAVVDVLKSAWLTQGERTRAFEEAFSLFLANEKAPHVTSIAVSNCTAALHMALMCAGIGAGDEVIIPALTFVADANVVMLCGATPVFADAQSLQQWGVSADTIESRITDKTKAVIVVHYAGMPCDMAPIRELCTERGLVLIEDCAHAVGSKYRGKMCGTLADIACFSFFSNKNLSVGEGGMFVSANADYVEKARLLRSHGMTSLTIDRWKNLTVGYDVLMPGHNFRMDEIRAALGLTQLEKLESMNARRAEFVTLYNELIVTKEDIIPFWAVNSNDDCIPTHHIYPVLLPEHWSIQAFAEYMKGCGVQTSRHYEPIPHFSAYRHHTDLMPVTEKITNRLVTLPLFSAMTQEQVRYVVSCVEGYQG